MGEIAGEPATRGLRARVIPRDGLGAVGRRLAAEPIRIAYFGASVTAQRSGYRPRLHAALCALSGQPHIAISAGFGGIGSPPAAFLLDWLVIDHRPDLCLVEYASGDLGGAGDPERIAEAMVAIAEKLLGAGCRPCFLYLFRRDIDYRQCHPVLAAHEGVAERYGIPSVDLGAPTAAALASGAVSAEHLLRDVVHTSEAGSELVAAALASAVSELLLTTANRSDGGSRGAMTVPPRASRYRGAGLRAAELDAVTDPRAARRERFRLLTPRITLASGNAYEACLDRDLHGLVVVVGPRSGVIRVSAVDTCEEHLLWDGECHRERLHAVMFNRSYPAGSKVRIEPTEAPIDYSASRLPFDPEPRRPRELSLVALMVTS